MFGLAKKATMPRAEDALPGREESIAAPSHHAALGTPLLGPFPGSERAMFGMGCFWGAERKFWQIPGVLSTMVGYAAGFTKNPTYREVCTGRTGHNEVVQVIFDPTQTSYQELLRVFFENHDPTQGMRQGNDVGTQYRSGIYTYDSAQQQAAEQATKDYGKRLAEAGFGAITTEVIAAPTLYLAEEYHQQYLHKNPDGYCGLGGTGISCPLGLPLST
jgi:peptide-methionine (S)-S-oxide reductase